MAGLVGVSLWDEVSYDTPSFGFSPMIWKLATYFRDRRSYDLLSFRRPCPTRCIVPAPYGGCFVKRWIWWGEYLAFLIDRSFHPAGRTIRAHFAKISILTCKIECRMTFYLFVSIFRLRQFASYKLRLFITNQLHRTTMGVFCLLPIFLVGQIALGHCAGVWILLSRWRVIWPSIFSSWSSNPGILRRFGFYLGDRKTYILLSFSSCPPGAALYLTSTQIADA